jgi:hypothetical protein
VQKTRLSNRLKAVDNVPENRNCFFLGQFLSFFEEVFEVALVAELCDYVAVVDGTVNIVAFENVDMVNFLQCINLTFEHLPSRAVGDRFEVDDFDRNHFFGFLVQTSEHARTEPFADQIVQSV